MHSNDAFNSMWFLWNVALCQFWMNGFWENAYRQCAEVLYAHHTHTDQASESYTDMLSEYEGITGVYFFFQSKWELYLISFLTTVWRKS